MEAWQEDHLNALLEIRSADELFNQLTVMARHMGFEYCAYGIRMPVPVSRPTIVMLNNYAPAWRKRYEERNYLEVDPTVRHGLLRSSPIVWSNQIFHATPELWEEARSHGLNYGWAQSSRDVSGAVGLLSLSRSSEPLLQKEIAATRAQMAWMTQFAHAALSKVLVAKHVPETHVVMTAREREVLRWTAEGKTAYEIGQILSVSERTVNFHINNVVMKLGASNKTQAAVKAATLGMLL